MDKQHEKWPIFVAVAELEQLFILLTFQLHQGLTGRVGVLPTYPRPQAAPGGLRLRGYTVVFMFNAPIDLFQSSYRS